MSGQDEEYPWPRGQLTQAVLRCAHCNFRNKPWFVPAVPGDDPLDEIRVFDCDQCGKWNQIVSADGHHSTEPLERKPARKGTSGPRPLTSAFETNRRRH